MSMTALPNTKEVCFKLNFTTFNVHFLFLFDTYRFKNQWYDNQLNL